MPGYLLLVFSNPVDGQDKAYNDWYDGKHLADVLDVPGIADARRYELAAGSPSAGDGPPEHRYLAVYELDGDPDEVMTEFKSRAASGRMALSEALDRTSLFLTIWGRRIPGPP